MVTKGYGFTVNDIDWLNPAVLEPYSKAYQLERCEKDALQWQMGIYFAEAITANFSKERYPEKPIFQISECKKCTEEEKQREVDLFFARENARRVNWRRNHGIKHS